MKISTTQRLNQISNIKELKTSNPIAYKKAVSKFAEQNLHLAYSYANRWKCKSIPMEDLKQQAVIGLMEAIHLFDPQKGSDWPTYALTRMRYTVSRYVQKKEPLVHTFQSVLDARRLLDKAQRQLKQSLGREATLQELCDHTGLSLKKISAALEEQIQFVPFDETHLDLAA